MLLTIETLDRGGSLALARNGQLIELNYLYSSQPHSCHLFPSIKKLLKKHELEPAELEAIGVCRGPGAFTAIRLGVTAAKVLAETGKVQLVSATSLRLLARFGAGYQGQIVAVVGARRGELYRQSFSWNLEEEALEELNQPAAVSPEKLKAELTESGGLIISRGRQWKPSPHKWPENVTFYPEEQTRGLAGALVDLTRQKLSRGADEKADLLSPCYIRRTDAEKQKEAER